MDMHTTPIYMPITSKLLSDNIAMYGNQLYVHISLKNQSVG